MMALCTRHGKRLQEWRLRSGMSILEGLGPLE
jgi:hypothetical protein